MPANLREIKEAQETLQPIADKIAKLKEVREAKNPEQAEHAHAMRNKHDAATKLQRELGELTSDVSTLCPHCEQPLATVGGKIVVYNKKPDPGRIEEIKEQIATLRDGYNAAKTTRDDIQLDINKLTEDIKIQTSLGRDIQARISELQGQRRMLERTAKDADLQPHEGVNEAERSRLENERDQAMRRFEAWVSHSKALRAHENVVEQSAVVKLLEPTGARGAYMAKYMDKVRAILKNVSETAGWHPITVTKQYEYTSNGRPVQLVAENERLKVQAALNIATAMLTPGCRWVIIDAADRMRDESWDGLVTVIDKLASNPKRKDLHLVVCATSTIVPAGWNSINLDEI